MPECRVLIRRFIRKEREQDEFEAAPRQRVILTAV